MEDPLLGTGAYRMDRSALPPSLARRVIELGPDDEARTFVRHFRERPVPFAQQLALGIAGFALDVFDVHARAGTYAMHFLSERAWAALVPGDLHGRDLLDVGAGQGFVTERARNVFGGIVAVEAHESLAHRLKERGIEAVAADLSTSPDAFGERRFGTVSLLNVLDRSERPLSLLSACAALVEDGGALVVSDPLPFEQRVFGPGRDVRERIDARRGGSWEEMLNDLYRAALEPLGFAPEAVSRLPYLSQGTRRGEVIALDAFVMVLRKPRRGSGGDGGIRTLEGR